LKADAMTTHTILGIGAASIIVGFILFAYRQGMQVKRPPEGVPPDVPPPPAS
jgi:hypothetical protein